MKIFEIFLLVLCVLYLIFYLYFIFKHDRPIVLFITNASISLILVAIINLTAFLSGQYLPVNEWTVSCATVTGVPGIVGMLILRYIFVL